MAKEKGKGGKDDLMLPQIMTMIRQPNRVTSASYDYTLTQQRVFLSIMKSLQEAINEIGSVGSVNQLRLFNTTEESIYIKLSMKEIARSKYQYDEVKEAIETVANIPFKFSGVDPITGTKAISVGGLFRAYIPEDKYKREITVEIRKDIAYRLVSIGEGWTKFAFEIAYNARNKYTPRIYQLISRWKDRGGFKMPMREFRDWLAIGDKYPDFKDFRKRVIEPSRLELFEKADCWFEIAEVVRENKMVSMLHFKIITPGAAEAMEVKKNNIIGILRLHFGFKDEHIDRIKHILVKNELHQSLFEKILELQEYIKTHPGIGNVPNYTVSTLLRRYKAKK